ncbi:helix-turn-helix domain-containing protein [Gracilibacillus timonensis]|uniref:helix-turn-helix domain-containing protein n=1 Tax=Gracilibacillus timonensis TaxID=1816696 RepID=UPI000824C135|nr:helix-turn-helix domain-containing protein [Gracilibacillus timonensis]
MNENFIGVGDRLLDRMNDLGLKQVDVSKATGISKNAMSNYVSGKRVPDTVGIYKLSKFLSVSIEWLLTGEEQPIIKEKASSNEFQILDRIRKLSDYNLMRIMGYLDALLTIEKEHSEKNVLSNSLYEEEATENGGEEA